MSATIKLKNGSGEPLAGDLVQGEPALDLTNKRLYTEDSGGTIIEIGINPTSLTTGTFTSTGIDDNATSTAITIDSSENVGIGTNNPTPLSIYRTLEIQGGADTGGAVKLTTTEGESGVLFNFNGGLYVQGADNTFIGTGDGTSASNRTAYRVDRTAALHRWYDPSDGSTERMRIDSSGNVGIGTVTPESLLTVQGDSPAITVNATNNNKPRIELQRDASTVNWRMVNDAAVLKHEYGDDSTSWTETYQVTSGKNHYWNTNQMALTQDGKLLVGTTNDSPTAGNGVKILPQRSTDTPSITLTGASSSTITGFQIYSTDASANRFFVRYDGQIFATSTSITAISDATLKENVRDLDVGLDAVMALQPRRFDWKNGDGNDVMGFVAQEVETVLPELVKEYDYNEDEIKKGLKMGDMLPAMVKAIQEQQAIIEDLKAKVEALENA